jgi:hypothetical protein
MIHCNSIINRGLVLFFLSILVYSNAFGQENTEQQEKSVSKTRRAANAVLDSIPDGVYDSMESFISKTPDSNPELTTRVVNYKEEYNYGCIVYFYDTAEEDKIRRKFAVKWNGGVYFSLRGIIDEAREGDRNLTSGLPNTYVRVIFSNARYYYAEADLISDLASDLGRDTLGSVIVAISGIDRMRGLVWDAKHHHFDIFRNCKDFNFFLDEQKLEPHLDCSVKFNGDLLKIREVIKSHLSSKKY